MMDTKSESKYRHIRNDPFFVSRRVFDQVNELPHSQQRRIISMVEDMLIAQATKQKAS
jgi:hypothetical protein